MRDFEKLCKQLEKLSHEDLLRYAGEKYGSSLRALAQVTDGDVRKASAILTICAMAAASVDGKFEEGEYYHIAGLITATADIEGISYEDAKALIEKSIPEKDSGADFVEGVYLTIAQVDQQASFDFIFFLAAICAADGDVCWKERAWIKKIYK